MTRLNDYLYPLYEAHARLVCDGKALHIEGLPNGPDSLTLPSFYTSGIFSIFHILEAMIPSLAGISILGIWTEREEEKDAPFCAFDLWIQSSENEGFYVPMTSAASLFSNNGIPYYHKPLI